MTDTVICEGCGRPADLHKPPEDIMAWRAAFPLTQAEFVNLADMGAICPACRTTGTKGIR